MTEQTTFGADESTASESDERSAADRPDAPDLDDDHPLANFRAAIVDDWESVAEARRWPATTARVSASRSTAIVHPTAG